MKAVIINDTSNQEHVGCQAVMSAYHRLLDDRDIEVFGTQTLNADWRSEDNLRMLDCADIVLVNGEGSIHHDKHKDLLEISKHYPSVLMNAVFESMTDDWSEELNAFKLVTVRETFSARYMKESQGIDPVVVPDLIFSTDRGGHKRRVSSGRYIGDSVLDCFSGSSPQVHDEQFIKEFIGHTDACLGRFHVIAIAAMFGVPFSAWGSNTWKNEAIMFDMGVPELYAEELRDAMDLIPASSSKSVRQYASTAAEKIHSLFDVIANNDY